MGDYEKNIALETKKDLEQGYYFFDNNKVVLPLTGEIYSRVEIISPQVCQGWQKNEKEVFSGRIQGVGKIKVLNLDSFSAVREEKMQGCLVLNFADSLEWGGNFLQGTVGQEQSLCRNSTLSLSLGSAKAQKMYEHNRALQNEFAVEYMLFTPYVDIIRDGENNFQKHPWRCSVLSAPAIDLRRVRSTDIAQVEPVMLERIRNILRTAIAFGYDELVLGAWGCGCFKHQAKDVAGYFAKVLCAENWQKYFKKVVFAVLDNSAEKEKLKAFQAVFAENEQLDLMESIIKSSHLDYFKRYRQRLNEIEHFVQGHEKDHPLRVIMLVTLIVDELDLSAEALETLYKAATFHDAGRVNGLNDPTHGELGAIWYNKHCEPDKAVEFLIKYHSIDDDIAKKDLAQLDFADKEEMWLLYCILKDADGLDRVRFKYYGNGALDEKYLRLKRSKKLLNVAYKLLESDLK